MASTSSNRHISLQEIDRYASTASNRNSHNNAELPKFARARSTERPVERVRPSHLTVAATPAQQQRKQIQHPQPAPYLVPKRESRRAPLVVRANRVLRSTLVAMCGVAIFGYGMDVAASNDVCKLQEQARRLNEQNSELSAQLLKAISYQGIQDSVVGRFGLHTPEEVLISKSVPPPPVPQFKPNKHRFPIISGY